MYSNTSVYVIGNAKTGSDNAITDNFNTFFIGFVIDTADDTIIDLECSATIGITSRFVYNLFIGKSMASYDEDLVRQIQNRYFGSSQKAIVIAYKDALKKYASVRKLDYISEINNK